LSLPEGPSTVGATAAISLVPALDPFELARVNLTSPAVLAFVLGALSVAIRSDLRLPDAVYQLLSMYLLLAVGLKGGVALAGASPGDVIAPAAGAIALSALIPLAGYPVLRALGRLSIHDAASIAAHYGSVSVVTFTAATVYLAAANEPVEDFMPALLALMEMPGIIVALVLAQWRLGAHGGLGEATREVMTGRSIVLLGGGLVIGLLAGVEGTEPIAPLFVDLFQGVLVLFLLELGINAAQRAHDVLRGGRFLVTFGVIAPVILGATGALVGVVLGLSPGGAAALATLSASASYIAAPAAVRIALPEANPGLSLAAALAITFPFNLIVGIPVYHQLAQWLHGVEFLIG
jgi:uncharacterized protein